MNLKKIFAAGLVVFGVVGMAGAASPGLTNALTGAKEQTATIELSYEVISIAEMTVTPGTQLSGASMLQYDPASFTNYTNPNATGANINVKTNYAKWDVELTFENGGRLGKSGASPWDPKKYLENNSGDTIIASVGIILRPLGATSGIAAPTAFADIPGVANTAIPTISFADVLGTRLGATLFDGKTGTAIATATTGGFNAPSNPDGVNFTVNVGYNTPVTSLGNNEDGIYTENMVFTMIASY